MHFADFVSKPADAVLRCSKLQTQSLQFLIIFMRFPFDFSQRKKSQTAKHLSHDILEFYHIDEKSVPAVRNSHVAEGERTCSYNII